MSKKAYQGPQIARQLVHNYPEHGFMIDAEEAASIGLAVDPAESHYCVLLEEMVPRLRSCTAIGRVQEVTP